MTSLDKSSKIAALPFWSCDDKHCQIHENILPLSSLRKNEHHAIQRKKIKQGFFLIFVVLNSCHSTLLSSAFFRKTSQIF